MIKVKTHYGLAFNIINLEDIKKVINDNKSNFRKITIQTDSGDEYACTINDETKQSLHKICNVILN